jgi:hypothetical protein
MLPESSDAGLLFEFRFRATAFFLHRPVSRGKARAVVINQPNDAQDEIALQSSSRTLCEVLFVVRDAPKVDRFDFDFMLDSRIQPLLKETWKTAKLSVTFHVQKDSHKTASASPENANLPSE